MDRFDVLVVGPGLGRDPLTLEVVAEILRHAKEKKIPMVIDADGLWLIHQRPQLLHGYHNAILTPNAMEFKRLADVLNVELKSGRNNDALQQITRSLDGPLVVEKGSSDKICDGEHIVECSEEGSLRRAGGQGDVLSGCIASFVAWAGRSGLLQSEERSALVTAAYGGCLVTRLASRAAFAKHGRSMGATDVIAELGRTVDELQL